MLDSIHELIEINHEEIRESKRERNLSIIKSAGFAALFAAGLAWHEEAVDGIDAFQNSNIPVAIINETSLDISIGVAVPLGLLELGSAGIAQYSIRLNRQRQNSLNELAVCWREIEAVQDTTASENQDRPS